MTLGNINAYAIIFDCADEVFVITFHHNFLHVVNRWVCTAILFITAQILSSYIL